MLPRLVTGERSISATGDAAPDLVWQRYRAPVMWPQWAPHLTAVQTSTPVIRPGTTGSVTALHLVRARFVVTAVDEIRRCWSWTVRVGPIRLDLVHDVTPTPAGGSRTGLLVRGPRGVIDAYCPVAAWALRRLVAA